MSPSRIRARPPSPNARGSLKALFVGKDPRVGETYERLARSVHTLGPVTVEAKRASIHLLAGPNGSAFAGLHPQKAALLLNIRSSAPIASPRVRKVEQVSKNRYHNEIRLESPDRVNGELLRWLRDAYELGSA